MKTILTIGHARFLLPASANVNVILKTLGGAQQVDRQYDRNETYVVRPDAPEISVLMVQDKQVIQPKKPKQIAEHAGPDAHNTFGG